MADKTEFLQAIDDAILDADSLERFINGADSETVLTRLSAEYPTLQNAIKKMFESGGLPATPFKTKALMTASTLVDGDYAQVTDDTVNNGLYVKTAGAWVKSEYDKLNAPRYMPTATTEIDELTEAGIYMPHSDSASVNFGLPGRVRGMLIVTGRYYPEQVMQIYLTSQGTFIRHNTGGNNWGEWTSSFSSEWFKGDNDTNLLYETGLYASAFNGTPPNQTHLPYDDDRFMLAVAKSTSTRQAYISSSGLAFRTSTSEGVFGEWSGIKTKKTGFHDLEKLENDVNDLAANSGVASKVIYGWGSSTLELAGSYLTQLAEAEGYTYVDHGVSGETLAVSGMQQGANVVTVKFTDATLTNNTNHAVTITQSFKPKRGRRYKEVELSNGVKGLLYFSENNGELANTFKPTNLTEPLEVDITYEYRAINPDFINQGKGLYYFDIGKNNMGYADTAQDIVDAQQEMIDYIPEGSEYLVGGHFINVASAGTDYGNKVEAVNQMLKLRYGLRFCDYYDFLYDDAVWQKHGITKTQADIDAISNGDLPPSLGRDLGGGTRDEAHLRDEMSEELAIQAINRFKELGYIN